MVRLRRQYVDIGVPRDLAHSLDKVIDQTSLGFKSRVELLRHVTKTYLLGLVEAKILSEEALKQIEDASFQQKQQ